jgi:hypothetical protein
MSLRPQVYPRAGWVLFVAVLAITALPVDGAKAQEAAEKAINASNNEDPAVTQEDQPFAQKERPPVTAAPAAPPTPPSYPRKPAKVDGVDATNDPFGAPVKVEAAQQKARALQEVMKALKQQQDQMAKQQAMIGKQLEELSKGSSEQPMLFDWNPRIELKKKVEAQALLADAQGNPYKIVAPLPANAVLRAFKLQYVKPEEIGQALHNITGGGGPRIAIDERTNALLIAGEDKQMGVVQQVIETLDQPAGQKSKGNDTLQVRVVWVLDEAASDGKAAEPPYVNEDVVEALGQLGFESPRVMCQQVTTLTFGREREGRFQFEVPVIAEGSPWQFRGEGRISPANDDRYSIEFSLAIEQPNNPQHSQLGGSILTPLGHYTVMGTSTFVAAKPGQEKESDDQPALKQHLSAFVIYLDKAPEFGAKQTVEVRK